MTNASLRNKISKIFLVTRWTVWLETSLQIENSTKTRKYMIVPLSLRKLFAESMIN